MSQGGSLNGNGGGGGTGTVTDFSFTNANGFVGNVSNPTTTPDLTLSTSVGTNQVIYANAGALTGSGVGTVASQLVVDATGKPSFNTGNGGPDISYFEDDFYYFTGNFFAGPWTRDKDIVNTFHPSTGTPGHPGVVPIWVDAANSKMNLQRVGVPSDHNVVYTGQGYIQFKTVIKVFDLATAIEDYQFTFGLGDFGIFSSFPGSDAIYFQYNRSASTNWTAVTKASNVTTTSSGTFPAVDTNWHVFMFEINPAGTLVSFYIDNTLIGTSSTNIPTAGMGIGYINYKTASAASVLQEIQVDYCKYANQLTTSRF